MAKQKKQKTNMGKVRPKIFHKMTSFRDALHQIHKPTLSEHLYLALPPAVRIPPAASIPMRTNGCECGQKPSIILIITKTSQALVTCEVSGASFDVENFAAVVRSQRIL